MWPTASLHDLCRPGRRDPTRVVQFVEEINRTGTLRATLNYTKTGANGQEFQVKVDLVHHRRPTNTQPS